MKIIYVRSWMCGFHDRKRACLDESTSWTLLPGPTAMGLGNRANERGHLSMAKPYIHRKILSIALTLKI